MDLAQRIDEAVQGSEALRHDNQKSIWFARQLKAVLRAANERLPTLPFASGRVLPIRGTVPEGLDLWEYYTYKARGLAKFFTARSVSDLPDVSASASKVEGRIVRLGSKYTYDRDDVEKGIATGVPLPRFKSLQARRVVDEKMNAIAVSGDPGVGVYGIANLPNGTVVDAPAAAAGPNPTRWINSGGSQKTQQEMLDDLNLIVDTCPSVTNEVGRVTVVGLPPSYWRLAKNTHFGTAADPSVLSRFLADNPGVRVEQVREFDNAGPGGNPIAMGWRPDPEFLYLESPMGFRQDAPVSRDGGWNWDVVAHQKTGGVIAYYPVEVIRLDFGDDTP